MRILLVNKFHYRRGGAETYYLELGAALERQGNDVAYFSMKHPQNIPCRWERFFVTQREYNDPRGRLAALRDGAALLYSWEARRLFQALCEEFQPEVVHLNNVHRQITLSILDAPYLRKRQAGVVYTAHDYITVCPSYLLVDGSGELCDRCVADGRYLHCLRRRCVKESRAKSALAAGEAYLNRALRMPEKIDCVIAPSRFMSSMLVKGGWPEGKVRVLRNFADLSQVNRTCMQRDAQDRSRPYFLFAGRLSPEKGLMDLIEAFRIAGGELSGWRLVIAGDGPLRSAVERGVETGERGSRIEFVGYQSGETLRRLIECAAFSVVPSRWNENMPFAILESLTAGTPVIGARIGGIPELVGDGRTGLLFTSRDRLSLAGALQRAAALFCDEGAYEAMRDACRRRALECGDSDCYAGRISALYRTLISGSR